MIVAIDGPAGSGKSTVARALSAARGLAYLDTGAMYRAVADACATRGVPVTDSEAVAGLARSLDLDLIASEGGTRVIVDGADRTAEIRNPEVDAIVSAVAAIPAVREVMVDRQRAIARGRSVVAEGRDIGTVVFPDAEVKVFLIADASARAHRRTVQRGGGDVASGRVVPTDAEQEARVAEELVRRDEADSTRKTAPLIAADDAITIDSTELTVEEVCSKICSLMDERSSR